MQEASTDCEISGGAPDTPTTPTTPTLTHPQRCFTQPPAEYVPKGREEQDSITNVVDATDLFGEAQDRFCCLSCAAGTQLMGSAPASKTPLLLRCRLPRLEFLTKLDMAFAQLYFRPLACAFFFKTASAAPVETTSWTAGPNGRGTFQLITSCVLTLTVCVWSALHLNVPTQNSTLRQRIIRRTKWILLGIFAPELVVSTAFAQYLTARWLYREIQKDIECHRSGVRLRSFN